MTRSRSFVVESIERTPEDGQTERLAFEAGLNLLVGRPNTGKTVWLRMLDYALGDPDAAEQTLTEELAQKYNSIRVTVRIGDAPVTLERRWKETGSKHKVFVDGNPIASRGLSSVLLDLLGIPLLHYPKGNPYSPRAWPELSWRSLYRHVYRQQRFWGGLVDQQPQSEQHACILQFLGLAESLFSAEYESLINARKAQMSLEAHRDGFMRILNQVSQELLDVEDTVAGITPGAISDAVNAIDAELDRVRSKREAMLEAVLAGSSAEDTIVLEELAEDRARLLSVRTAKADELEMADSRL